MPLKEFIQHCLKQNYESMVRSVEALSPTELSWQPDPQSMSIGFLAWHYGRTLDRWIHTRALGTPQLWEQGWATRFGRLPPDPSDTGYGFTAEQVGAFRVPAGSVLLDYAQEAKTRAMDFLQGLDDDTIEKTTVPNPRGGEITLAVMFEQLIWEFNQHGGQIAYLRGMQRGIEDPTYSGGMLEAAAKDVR